MLYNGLRNLVIENLHNLADEQIIPVFPNASTQDLMQQSQEAELLCKAVATVHEDHCSNMVKLGQILKYMVRAALLPRFAKILMTNKDRVYTISSNVPGTWELGLLLFREHIMRPSIRDHLINAILNQIRFEREGYVINRSAVKGSVEVFTSLYIEDDKTSLYEEFLEPAILAESRAYYKAEGDRLLQLCDASAFLKRVSNDLSCQVRLCDLFSRRWKNGTSLRSLGLTTISHASPHHRCVPFCKNNSSRPIFRMSFR